MQSITAGNYSLHTMRYMERAKGVYNPITLFSGGQTGMCGDSVKRMLPDAPLEPPYEGTKDMVLIEDIDDKDFWVCLFETMYEELPEPKRKKRG